MESIEMEKKENNCDESQNQQEEESKTITESVENTNENTEETVKTECEENVTPEPQEAPVAEEPAAIEQPVEPEEVAPVVESPAVETPAEPEIIAEVAVPGKFVVEIDCAGKKMTIETGEMARQADGSAWVKYGDTVVLATATYSKRKREGIDFFPLMVDFEEKMYAAGKIPGGFIKREGRPSESAILTARLIDRPIRPLFPDGMRNEVQVVCLVLSADQENSPDMPAMVAASTALSITGLPFAGPIAGARVSLINGEYIVNPIMPQLAEASMSIIVAGTADKVMMIEGEASEASEEELLKAIEIGHEEVKKLVAAIEQIKAKFGKPPVVLDLDEADKDLAKFIREHLRGQIGKAMRIYEKQEREEALNALHEAYALEILKGIDYPEKEKLMAILEDKTRTDFKKIFKKIEEDELRDMIIDEKHRPDGRGIKEVRPLSSRVGVLPRTHGSGLFTRGQTQVLTSVTLAPLSEGQTLDGLGIEESKRYMHQYNFPPFSVGETKPMRGPGRREIGHGALAERSLLAVLPGTDEFPYALRLVSEVLESNGSSSMASVCASTLALMDAAVPIKRPVAGIANGFVVKGNEYVILTDIQGMEDALGEMDFKVAGTREGITAIQMDIKVDGVGLELLKEAFQQSKEARFHILDHIESTIPKPRLELSPFAPRIFTMMIDPDKIRMVIGPGGKIINKIIEETGVKIDIENDGTIYVASSDLEMAEKAKAMIQEIIREPEVGEVYEGKVVRVTDFGAFIEFLPGKDGMIHISDLAVNRINRVQDVVNIGETFTVQIHEIDALGRINLKSPEVEKQRASMPRSESRPPRSGGGGGSSRPYSRPGGPPRGGGGGSRSGPPRGGGGRDSGGGNRSQGRNRW